MPAVLLQRLQAVGAQTNALPSLQPSSGDLVELLLKMTGAFLVVVAVLLLGAWFFRKSRLFALYQGGPAQLRILESRSLGFRNTLLVVAYSRQRFLLAASSTGVSLLTPLPDMQPGEPASGAPPSFADQLGGALQERKA